MASHISAHSIQPIGKKKKYNKPEGPLQNKQADETLLVRPVLPKQQYSRQEKSLVTYMTSRLVGTCILEIAYQLNHF